MQLNIKLRVQVLCVIWQMKIHHLIIEFDKHIIVIILLQFKVFMGLVYLPKPEVDWVHSC